MFQSDITNNLISQKVPQYIEKYKEYLEEKLNNERQYEKMMEVYNNNKDQPNYGCLYCKEIINILEVTGEFNCSIKFLEIEQLEQYGLNKFQDPNYIYILSVLSDESTMYMTEHSQYLFMIIINLQDRSFVIDENYYEIRINEYDPILSKSQQYRGGYRYDPNQQNESSLDKYCKDVILQKIEDDNMISISTEIYNYYNDKYLKLTRRQRREEIKRIFPFLCTKALTTLSRSLQKMKYFLYAKVTIEQSFHQYLMDLFNYQDFSQLTILFSRLTDNDLKSLSEYHTVEQQYEFFRKLTEDTEKGLTFDEFIDLMIKKINENYVNNQLDDFQIVLFGDNDMNFEDEEHREEDWDW